MVMLSLVSAAWWVVFLSLGPKTQPSLRLGDRRGFLLVALVLLAVWLVAWLVRGELIQAVVAGALAEWTVSHAARRQRPALWVACSVTAGVLIYLASLNIMAAALAGGVMALAMDPGRLASVVMARPLRPAARVPAYTRHALVCVGNACRAAGSDTLCDMSKGAAKRTQVRVTPVQCLGCCGQAPVVLMEPEGALHFSVRLDDMLQTLREDPIHAH